MTYDVDGNGTLSVDEIRDMVEKIFDRVKIKRNFDDYDFDNLYDEMDSNETGIITKSKLRHFLHKLGRRPPNLKLKLQLKLKNFGVRDGKLVVLNDNDIV